MFSKADAPGLGTGVQGTITLQQLHKQLALDPLMQVEMARPRQLKSYEPKALARQQRKREMLGSLQVLSRYAHGQCAASPAAQMPMHLAHLAMSLVGRLGTW